jgi:hypothetical protein
VHTVTYTSTLNTVIACVRERTHHTMCKHTHAQAESTCTLATNASHILTGTFNTQAAYRMVPGADAKGFVAPIMVLPYFTTSLPSHTMATTGPEDRKVTSLGKKGLPSCSA